MNRYEKERLERKARKTNKALRAHRAYVKRQILALGFSVLSLELLVLLLDGRQQERTEQAARRARANHRQAAEQIGLLQDYLIERDGAEAVVERLDAIEKKRLEALAQSLGFAKEETC